MKGLMCAPGRDSDSWPRWVLLAVLSAALLEGLLEAPYHGPCEMPTGGEGVERGGGGARLWLCGGGAAVAVCGGGGGAGPSALAFVQQQQQRLSPFKCPRLCETSLNVWGPFSNLTNSAAVSTLSPPSPPAMPSPPRCPGFETRGCTRIAREVTARHAHWS